MWEAVTVIINHFLISDPGETATSLSRLGLRWDGRKISILVEINLLRNLNTFRNIIESAIKQIQNENITPIGHYPRDGFVNDHFAESRCSSVLSNKTFSLSEDQKRRSSLG